MSIVSLKDCKIHELYIWSSIVFIFVGISIPDLKYLIYLTLPLGVLVSIADNPKLEREFIAFYGLIIYASLTMIFYFNFDAVKDLLFILCPLVAAHSARKVNLDWCVIFVISIIAFFVYIFSSIFIYGGSIGGVNILESQTLFESSFCFLFGLFLLVSIKQKRRLYIFVFLFLIFVSLKRIVILGLIGCLLLYWLDKNEKQKKIIDVVFVLLFIADLLLVVGISIGDFDYLISDLFNVSANHFTMGRQELYKSLLSDVFISDWQNLFGHGIGSVYERIALLSPNLHSDMLKVFYELGLFLFVFFFYFLFRMTSGFGRYAVLYTCALFLTDNVLIYSFYMFFMMICMLPETTERTMNINHQV